MSRNNYSVVQSSFDEEEPYLFVLPSSWVVKKGWNKGVSDKLTKLEGGDMCYWPAKAAGYRLLEKAKKMPNVEVDRNLLVAYRCKIKRIGFQTYNDACKEQKEMEMYSDTDEIVPKKRMKTDTRAADMFAQILNQSQNATPKANPRADHIRSVFSDVNDQAPVSNEPHLVDSRNNDSFSSDSDGSVQGTNNFDQTMYQGISQPTDSEPQEEAITLEAVLERVKNLENQVNKCLLMLSQISAKIDAIGSRNPTDKADDEEQIDVKKNVLEPVSNLAELEAVEQKCMDDRFVESVICSLGKVHGKHRFTGAGQTVCLQLIDYFVDRRFLRNVSWTGVSKTKDQHGKLQTKIAFSKYTKFIELFFQTVLNADELFSLEACHKFLKQCIRNSKQRLEDIKQVRASVSRKRCRKIAKMDEDLGEDDDDPASDGVPNCNHTMEPDDLVDSQEMDVEVLEETVLKSENMFQ